MLYCFVHALSPRPDAFQVKLRRISVVARTQDAGAHNHHSSTPAQAIMLRSSKQLATAGCRMGRSSLVFGAHRGSLPPTSQPVIVRVQVLGVSGLSTFSKQAPGAARSSMTTARCGHHRAVTCGTLASRGGLPVGAGRWTTARGTASGGIDMSMWVEVMNHHVSVRFPRASRCVMIRKITWQM